MKKIVEILKFAGTDSAGAVTREYCDIGFLGACRRLWSFWKHNGTHLDDYDEFRIRVIERKAK